MDTRQLEYILAIAGEKNLSKAAEKLFITQSALSQQLAKLKKEGLPPLFEHNRREMQLTDAGKIYVNGAHIILKLEEDAMRRLQNLSGGPVNSFHISIAPHLLPLFYTRVLPKLHRAFPQTELLIHPLEAGKAHQSLENRETDLVLLPSLHPARDLFRYQIVGDEELILVSLPGRTGAALPLILPEPGTHLRNLCGRALSAAGITPLVYAETNDIHTCLELVRQGECAAILPESCVREDGLELCPLSPSFHFHTVAACRRNARSPVADSAIREMKELF